MVGTQTRYTGPTKTYRQSHGVFRNAPVANGGVIYVDLTDAMSKLQVALNVYSEEVKQRALYNAVNKLGDKLLTAVRRDVAHETGAKYGRVMKAIKADRAHPNRLFYRIVATDTAMKVSDFARGSLKAGAKNPSASPWNKTRRFKGAFVIRFKSGATEIVKRIGRHNKGGKIRVLWGPIIPKEMIRAGNPSTAHIASAIPEGLAPVLMHELEQAVARAKAASGT